MRAAATQLEADQPRPKSASVRNFHYGPARLRPVSGDGDARDLEIVLLRRSGRTLAEIGRRFGLSRQRVAQIVDEAGRIPAPQVVERRRESNVELALHRVDEIIEAFRAGRTVRQISHETGLPYRAIRRAIEKCATPADRERRKECAAPPVVPPTYTSEELVDGLRCVARELGHAPSGPEYAELAANLALASRQTIYQRFGGWRKALEAADLESSSRQPPRAPTWHIAACWNAVKSVADQLGNPPRYRRYVELYAERDDLPSPATLRVRLGLWSEIAAALAVYADADRATEREARAA